MFEGFYDVHKKIRFVIPYPCPYETLLPPLFVDVHMPLT